MEVAVVTEYTIGTLIEYTRKNFLKVNHEYQRGLRWKEVQKCMFIDSIFRGYSIPAFYLDKKELSAAGDMKSTHYEIVDGQQRVEAIYSYSEGAFALLDPSDNSGFRFPNFVKNDECPWGGKRFKELPEELKEKLLSHKIVVYAITATHENEIRDLFIRLQGGTPLTPQDKRDSWPGNFTNFVLRIGGKTGVEKWYGLPLFKKLLKANNESTRRHIVAQIFMLFWEVRKEKKFCELQSSNIDEFYHRHIDFDEKSNEAKRFEKICEKLYQAFQEKPKIVGHHLIHLFLTTDSLLDDYRSGTWENHLAEALHEFETRCKKAADDVKKDAIEPQFHRYWTDYAQWTRASADKASAIQRRQAFFAAEVSKLLPLQKLDEKRVFNEFERQTVFFRDLALCQLCMMNSEKHKIPWNEVEIHHVTPYAEGGPTSMDNAALVHKDCHPKSSQQISEFSNWWSERRRVPEPEDPGKPRSGRRIAEKHMYAEIPNDKLIIKFEEGERKEWALSERHDMEGNRRDRNAILEWVRDQGATTGQMAAVVKKLNNKGYRIQ